MSQWIAFQIAGDEGLPLVFLHGLGGDAEQWRPQLDAFADRYRAIAWDMPGYGDSAPLESMTFPALAEAVSTLLDRLDIRRAHLVGHAIGGLTALAFASTFPDRLRSLSLVATNAAFGDRVPGGDPVPGGGAAEEAEDWRDRFIEQRLGPLDRGASLAELAPKIVKGLIGDRADPEGLEQAILGMAGLSESGYRAAVRCLANAEVVADLALIQTPTLLIAGEKDPVAPPEAMQRMADAMPDARLKILPHAGHLANLEQPAAFNDALDSFLKTLIVH